MSKRKRSDDDQVDADAVSSQTKHTLLQPSSAESSLSTVVASHYNNIKETGLDVRNKSRIVYMRNFNNWIKSMLINEYVLAIRKECDVSSSLRVLDMCCGKGGDLLKWKNNDVKHLICVDLAQISVEQCEQRYNEMKERNTNSRCPDLFSAEFVTADCTKMKINELFGNQDQSFDIVSCQFSFHYSFESVSQAECMVRNAADNLRPGGYFIGTIPDANDIVLRLRQTNTRSFGNDVFKIQFSGDVTKSFPLFGARYDFFLEDAVNCPEFLVHFPTFVKLAAKHGLKLVMKERFRDYFQRMNDTGRQLLGRMQAFETYPAFGGSELQGKVEEYIHADEYMKRHRDCRRIGTLSKSEWEATCKFVSNFSKLRICSICSQRAYQREVIPSFLPVISSPNVSSLRSLATNFPTQRQLVATFFQIHIFKSAKTETQ
ncbi:hypothetical protein V9T40_011735 [Parthenolecanium corni]|uniref:mRNA cap guanine-N(7) methyltransferase n=1 Tax=Parthenolecanium corni TaxID=536013 RepID=A0AAN9XYU8_9HEMI